MANKTIVIESLESGYVWSEGGRRTALSKEDDVKQLLTGLIYDLTYKYADVNVRTMVVSIDVTINPPKAVNPQP